MPTFRACGGVLMLTAPSPLSPAWFGRIPSTYPSVVLSTGGWRCDGLDLDQVGKLGTGSPVRLFPTTPALPLVVRMVS